MKTKHWIFILLGIVIFSLLLLILPKFFTPEAPIAEIYQDGVLIETISLTNLNAPATIPVIKGDMENVLLAEDKGIQMISANCPDQLCIHQGKIKHSTTSIVCLPHRLVIQIKNSPAPVDAVSK